MTNCDISVIICTHTQARWQYLIDAVQSVQDQTLPPREIVLVIDHNPALLELAQAQFPGVRVIENQEPKGASGARNSAIAEATSNFVAFLDDDAVAEPDWLETLMMGFGNADVIGVGGLALPCWPKARPRWFPLEFDWVIGCTHRGMPETVAPIRNLIGCNMSMRRQIFESLGGFRHGIGPAGGRPLGCEETEFCIRVSQQLPQKVWLHQPRARVHHQVPVHRTTWRYFFERCYGEGLSKALITNLVGTQAGLATERQYVFRTLPVGVLRGLRDLLFRFDIGGLGRATAIVLGLAVTTISYLKGRLFVPRVRPESLAPISAGARFDPESTS